MISKTMHRTPLLSIDFDKMKKKQRGMSALMAADNLSYLE
jgi:hypothetical protein